MSANPSIAFNAELADRLAHSDSDLAGSLYAVPPAHRAEAARLLHRKGHWIHADVFDDPTDGVSVELIEQLADEDIGPIDVHLLTAGALTALDVVCRRGIARVTFPYVPDLDTEAIAARIRAAGAAPWLAIAPDTGLAECRTDLTHVDGLLVMLIEPGTRRAAEPAQLSKVEAVHGSCTVGVDGGVDEDTIGEVLSAGTNYVVIGRRLFASPSGDTGRA